MTEPMQRLALGELESWPMWAAEASTTAVEDVIIEAEVINLGGAGLAKKFADS